MTPTPHTEARAEDSVLADLREALPHGSQSTTALAGWLVFAVALTLLSRRLAHNRSAGRIRRAADQLLAAARLIGVVALAGLIVAQLPSAWLLWAGIAIASAAVAIGWSLRPPLADLGTGLFLGLRGRLTPGVRMSAPEGQGTITRPGPLTTILRLDDSRRLAVPNRMLRVHAATHAPGHSVLRVDVPVPEHRPAPQVLDALRRAAGLLPWRALDVSPRIQPHPTQPGVWQVEVHLVGHDPPVDALRAALPGLVQEALRQPKESTEG